MKHDLTENLLLRFGFMTKLDYEHPKYQTERILPDQLEVDTRVSFPQEIAAQIYIKRFGKKWVLYEPLCDTTNLVYATVYPISNSLYPVGSQKVVVGACSRNAQCIDFIRLNPTFPDLPFLIKEEYISVAYQDNYDYKIIKSCDDSITSINDFIREIYRPLVRFLITHRLAKTQS